MPLEMFQSSERSATGAADMRTRFVGFRGRELGLRFGVLVRRGCLVLARLHRGQAGGHTIGNSGLSTRRRDAFGRLARNLGIREHCVWYLAVMLRSAGPENDSRTADRDKCRMVRGRRDTTRSQREGSMCNGT